MAWGQGLGWDLAINVTCAVILEGIQITCTWSWTDLYDETNRISRMQCYSALPVFGDEYQTVFSKKSLKLFKSLFIQLLCLKSRHVHCTCTSVLVNSIFVWKLYRCHKMFWDIRCRYSFEGYFLPSTLHMSRRWMCNCTYVHVYT